VLLPVCFLKVFFHKMIMIFVYSKSHRIGRADKFMQWVTFTITGPIRLTANMLVDMVVFLQHCTVMNLRKMNERTKEAIAEKPLSKANLVMVKEYFVTRNERLIPFKQVASEIRDQMSIFPKIK